MTSETQPAPHPAHATAAPPRGEPLPLRLGYVALNLVQAAFVAVWTAFCVSAACVALLVSRRLPLVMARHLWAPPLVRISGARLEVSGHDNVRRDEPQIFVSNHQSMLDIALVFQAIPVNLRFVLKKELAYVPFIGLFAWATGMIFVDRKNRRAAVASLERVGRLVRAGRTIIAFPEGTRSRGQGILPFKKGVFVSAVAAQVPVVPVAIEGADRVLPSDGFRVRPSVVRVKIGTPIPTQGLSQPDAEHLMRQAREAVTSLYDSIRLPPASLH
ncbi:MAG: 1-acyl-sn-glycerol-3-phosphate acyltransferase [Myxococcales bacterium]|nr:1-acyl-sn-glycerol-3-phosphate acyltransferase [Myxococcales bacterium]